MERTMRLRNGKILVKKDNYYERLKYFSDMYNSATNMHIQACVEDNVYAMMSSLKRKIEGIYNIYSLLYDAFEQIHREYIRCANKKEESFINLITVLEKRGYIIIQDIEQNHNHLKDLKNIIEKTIQKIQKHVKLHKNEKNNLLCRLSCKLGSHLTLYVNSFL